MNTKQALDEFKSVQGVTGAYIYSAKGNVIANNLPEIYKEAKLLNIGKALAKLYSAGGLTFPDISDIFLSYEESIVIGREIADKSYLIILSEPSLNVNLVTLTMNLIKDDIKVAIQNGAPTQPVIAEELPAGKKVTANDLLETGALAAPLQEMQAALAKVMGPMAKVIFIESVEKWQAACMPSSKNLLKLMEIIIPGIKDPEKVHRYEEMVKSIIMHKGK